jgi:hypothetical protein
LWNEELLEHVQILTAGAVAVAVLGTTVLRASNLQCSAIFGQLKRCVCPIYKFVYSFKVVKLFLKHPVYCSVMM